MFDVSPHISAIHQMTCTAGSWAHLLPSIHTSIHINQSHIQYVTMTALTLRGPLSRFFFGPTCASVGVSGCGLAGGFDFCMYWSQTYVICIYEDSISDISNYGCILAKTAWAVGLYVRNLYIFACRQDWAKTVLFPILVKVVCRT